MRLTILTIAIILFSAHPPLRAFTGECRSDSLERLATPIVGKRCPNFHFDDVRHFSKSDVSLSDFRGKWLFLTFWFKGCSTCLKFLKTADMFQAEFPTDIQFLMIGVNDHSYNRNIEQLYEKLRLKQDLKLAVTFDSVLIKKWGIFSMPHIVVVDPQGIVRVITDGRDMTVNKIKDLVVGRKVTFYLKDMENGRFEPGRFLNGDLSNNLIYSSILTKWSGENSTIPESIFKYLVFADSSSFSVGKVPLWGLYNYAYFGQWWWNGRTDPHYAMFGKRPY